MVEYEYAKAIYELAIEEDKEKSFSECFKILIDSLNSKEFMDILTSPFINKNEKKRIINEVYKGFDDTFINFMLVIIDHNRFSSIKSIYAEYNKLILNKHNVIRAQLISAKSLSNVQINHYTEILSSRYENKKLELENIVDENIIGGIQVICNGESIDISLKNSLDKLKKSI